MAFTELMLQDAFNEAHAANVAAAEAQTAAEASDDFALKAALTAAQQRASAAKAYLKHAKATRQQPAIIRFMKLAEASLIVRANALDADGFTLNTAAGMVDLRTGAIRPHDPGALCTKLSPYSPGIEGAAEWNAFLELVTGGDTELKAYLQVCAGSCAIGKVLHEGIFIAVGGGRNGKSTLFNALAAVLGDYSGGISVSVLTTAQQNRGAALATLRGRRLVTAGELEEGSRLSVSTLKQLASTDPLTIEEKYKSPETVAPSHHIVLYSNYLPRVGSTDNGTWRRLTVLPFNTTMPVGRGEIKNYADHLAKHCGGAILNWIISGAVRFFLNGCRLPDTPAVVQQATSDYRKQEDWIGRFLDEHCTLGANERVPARMLYDAYKAFADECGDYRRRENDFSAALASRGYDKRKLHGTYTWFGLRLSDVVQVGSPGIHVVS